MELLGNVTLCNRSILPSAPSDDGNDNDNDIEDEYPRSKFDKYYDEKEELKRIKSRREEELARRQNEVLPREEQRKGKMELMKLGDFVSFHVPRILSLCVLPLARYSGPASYKNPPITGPQRFLLIFKPRTLYKSVSARLSVRPFFVCPSY